MAAGTKPEGRGAGSQGCAPQRPPVPPQTPRHAHTDMPSELDSHRFVHRPRRAQRHTQIADALINTLGYTCGHTHPCLWFFPCITCRNTASGWVTEAGPLSWALSTVYCPTGMTPPGSELGAGEGLGQTPVSLHTPPARSSQTSPDGRLGSCPLQFDLRFSLRSQTPRVAAERGGKGARTTAEESHLYSTAA